MLSCCRGHAASLQAIRDEAKGSIKGSPVVGCVGVKTSMANGRCCGCQLDKEAGQGCKIEDACLAVCPKVVTEVMGGG